MLLATTGQVAAWLQEAHGIKRAVKSIYRWLGKANGALRVPRPAHVLQNPPATAAFRAELEQKLEQLALPKDKPVKIWPPYPEPALLGLARPAGRDPATTAV